MSMPASGLAVLTIQSVGMSVFVSGVRLVHIWLNFFAFEVSLALSS